ncbi:hypothetical protein K435DRAFT_783063 [Dendrothele bispora CBS 962.96]|uniref:Uncharacterized protein n=1 Tax=Dendrothele bispora (strain CBS 962.96) TaxID=1314807 RepID=A0A4S8LB16_DENBC|nr:hypothetical protein K435DRAFT_783063 [Dendrothele bispora CBS 962.96]
MYLHSEIVYNRCYINPSKQIKRRRWSYEKVFNIDARAQDVSTRLAGFKNPICMRQWPKSIIGRGNKGVNRFINTAQTALTAIRNTTTTQVIGKSCMGAFWRHTYMFSVHTEKVIDRDVGQWHQESKTARCTPLPERLKPNNINGTMPSGRDWNVTDIKVDIDLEGTTSHSDRNSHRRH